MEPIFAERQMFAKRGNSITPTVVIIFKPEPAGKKGHLCRVVFRDDKKYNANINGADEFNSIECALSYIHSVCSNSDDPEFYWEDGESMKSSHGKEA